MLAGVPPPVIRRRRFNIIFLFYSSRQAPRRRIRLRLAPAFCRARAVARDGTEKGSSPAVDVHYHCAEINMPIEHATARLRASGVRGREWHRPCTRQAENKLIETLNESYHVQPPVRLGDETLSATVGHQFVRKGGMWQCALDSLARWGNWRGEQIPSATTGHQCVRKGGM